MIGRTPYRSTLAAVALTFALGAGSAHADIIGKKPFGVWRVSDALSSAACVVELKHQTAQSGDGYAFDAWGCEALRAGFDGISAWQWSYDTGLLLVNESGNTVAQFDLAELDGLTSVVPASHFMVMRPEGDARLADLIKKAVTVTAQR